MTDTVRDKIARSLHSEFGRMTQSWARMADDERGSWLKRADRLIAMLATSPQDEEGQREPLEPVVYGDERDELLALIRKRCPDFTAFPECPPEDMVKGGDTERKNDEAIERAFQDFRLAASPQGEGSSADCITHDGGPNPVPGRDGPERFDPCGGCGETNPANRCVGCLHLFSVTEGVKP